MVKKASLATNRTGRHRGLDRAATEHAPQQDALHLLSGVLAPGRITLPIGLSLRTTFAAARASLDRNVPSLWTIMAVVPDRHMIAAYRPAHSPAWRDPVYC